MGFRYQAAYYARNLGLTGWVRNCPDGSVELEAQGDPYSVEEFLQAVSQGPGYAQVDQVYTAPRALEDEHSFRVVGY